MKSLVQLVIGIAIVLVLMVFTGVIQKDQLLELIVGNVEMGETTTVYKEEDFIHVFDVILGEMPVTDTSFTEFKRSRGFFGCESAFVITETQAVVKYEVKTNPALFFVDVEKKEYYVSPNLDVTYHEADKSVNTYVKGSNCIREKDIKPEDIAKSKAIAARNFKKSIEESKKWKEAKARFLVVKEQLLDKLSEAGFTEAQPRGGTNFNN